MSNQKVDLSPVVDAVQTVGGKLVLSIILAGAVAIAVGLLLRLLGGPRLVSVLIGPVFGLSMLGLLYLMLT